MFSNVSNSTRILVKGLVTGFLILAMLIPSIYVMSLVEERQRYQRDVINEVSDKWSNAQTLTGPYLVIPYSQQVRNEKNEMVVQEGSMALLPEILNIDGNLEPVIKRRSIYKVALYRSGLQLTGHFLTSELKSVEGQTLHWDRATLCMGIADSRGIEKQLQGTLNGQQLIFDAGIPNVILAEKGAHAPLNFNAEQVPAKLDFALPISLRGSEQLHVMPLGKTTNFHLTSAWRSPSFDGKFLPDYTLSDTGFDARWQVLHFNRDFPQVWNNKQYNERGTKEYSFGVSLVQPVDNYDKTLRSVKYAILFVGLTFGFFFMFELLMGYRVHPVQYLLVGLALVIFFTLLLSISEFIGFNKAYAMSAAATIGLITLYAKSLFATWRNATMAGGFVALLYAYIFILIQLEDTALLAGSIGLFLLVALAMYFSRKINWYNTETTNTTS